MATEDRPFLTDVKTLRARARQHIEQGAITESYRADRATVQADVQLGRFRGVVPPFCARVVDHPTQIRVVQDSFLVYQYTHRRGAASSNPFDNCFRSLDYKELPVPNHGVSRVVCERKAPSLLLYRLDSRG